MRAERSLGDDVAMGWDERTTGVQDDQWSSPASTTGVNPWVVVGFAAVVFVAALGVFVFVFMGRGAGPQREPSAVQPSVAPVVTTVTVVPGSTSVLPAAPTTTIVRASAPTVLPTEAPRVTAPQADPNEAAAFRELARIVDADRGAAEGLVGVWVPQLSSKQPGLDVKQDDRGRYSVADVLSDHLGYEQRYRARGMDVVLVKSDDFNFKVRGYLVTVLDLPFPTGEAVNAWCDSQGIGVDDCFAKRLEHGDWHGSVLPRT